ncbi:MAG: PAS domain-containing protein [Rhizobiales bacterium]|nr:PAS domain-containing protein [Hyphomicrobiales bacterium]
MKPPFAAIGLILLLLACLAAGAAYLFWKNYQDARAQLAARADSGSQVVSAHVGWALETVRQILQRVDESLGPDLSVPAPDAEAKLAQSVATLPGSLKVYVVDADGATRLTTDPQFKPIDVRDREYFQAVAKGEAWHVTPLLVSRLNGEQIFVISRRIERDGKFAGAAIVSLTSDFMREIWQTLNLDAKSTVSLIRDDGQLVSRYPLPDGPLDLSKYILFTDYLPKAPSGTYEAISPADGESRVVAYRRVPQTNLVALASVSKTQVLAALWNNAAWALALGIPAILALFALAYWTFTLLRKDAREREVEAQFRVLAEAMPNHVWTARPDGKLDWFNSRIYDYTGATLGSLDGGGWVKVVHPEDLDETTRRWSAAIANGEAYENEFRLRRKDGVFRWHIVRAHPIKNDEGKVLQWIGTNTDIDDQKRTGQALADSERRFRLSQSAARIASLEVDVKSGQVYGSERFWEIWGLPPHEQVPISVLEEIVIPEDRHIRSNAETRRDGTASPVVEYRIRRPDNGEIRWLSRHVEFAHDAADKPIKMYGVVQDITDQKEAQARQQVLTHELAHRIKNMLAMIAAIASQTLRSGTLESARDAFLERIRALGNAHDVLLQTQWASASILEVLKNATAHLPENRVALDGPDVALEPRKSLSLALAVNELATNALKYGALSTQAGTVTVSWSLGSREGDGASPFRWSWQEMGGPPVVRPARRGFGTFLIERVLAADFDGNVNIDYRPNGLVVTLDGTLKPVAERAAA